MKLEWNFTAESYLDQLSPEERSKVLHAVEPLPAVWDKNLSEARLKKLIGDQNNLYSLRVGSDLRVLVRRQNDVITVVDVVRRSQIDGLRRVSKISQAMSK
jgi:mRNA-degrading endonuclease RelE of RelBE toxin-antitoxin system